jgi:branched-chain amino acid transport system substrate-binding protein
MPTRSGRLLVATALCVSVLAACGSSSKSSSSTSSPAGSAGPSAGSGTSTTAAATKSTYVIGSVSDATGLSAAPGMSTEIQAVIHAWTEWTNTHGGINGHPVKVIYMDSMGDPGRALSDIETLVQNDHVLALVANNGSGTEAGYASYLEKKHVANIGGADYTPLWTSNPVFFPTATTLLANLASEALIAQKAGKDNLGIIYCSTQTACSETIAMYQAIAPLAGVKFVSHVAANPTEPNYTAQCLAAKSDGANAIFNEGLPPLLFQDCAQQDYNPMWLLYQAIPSLLAYSKYLQGAQGDDLDLPYFADVPGYTDFHQAMAEYAKGVTYSSISSRMWIAFEVFAAAMANAGDNPTQQTVFDGMYSLPPNYTVNGVAPPLNYVRNKPTPSVNCFFVFGMQNANWTLPYGTNDVCLPPSITTSPLAKSLIG